MQHLTTKLINYVLLELKMWRIIGVNINAFTDDTNTFHHFQGFLILLRNDLHELIPQCIVLNYSPEEKRGQTRVKTMKTPQVPKGKHLSPARQQWDAAKTKKIVCLQDRFVFPFFSNAWSSCLELSSAMQGKHAPCRGWKEVWRENHEVLKPLRWKHTCTPYASLALSTLTLLSWLLIPLQAFWPPQALGAWYVLECQNRLLISWKRSCSSPQVTQRQENNCNYREVAHILYF